jgi:hypothetical protein
MPVIVTANANQRLPKRPRKNEKQDWINDDRVGNREESDGTGTESERGHGYEGVGGVEIAPD